ncbi:2-dehydropantoate 2-reductase [Egibacter rhizosphaerae]|uniref:2-dehydropantoate 2-reductase n=1 Tax=Egibacter rhizosphaerae TaxID=1670831 RepID=A0A411YH38_9ACTN|nr:2-dehydropantoate 2-reductase [Egibacter rhizosphaerae]QBI20392.1 2-dehydropantoate 2-reductase [Egibacter rhizosphaerae]
MRIAVIGCGAVGSIFAAHLAQLEDAEVWAYDVDTAHVDAINAHGLRLSGQRDLTGWPRATGHADELPPCDLGIVATKSYVTEPAIRAVAASFADGAVCSVQNGVGNEEVIAGHVARVIRGTTFPAGRILEPGHVAMDTGGKVWVGPFEDQPARMDEVEALADALNRAQLDALAMTDARGAQWTKVIFNAATNPLGALTGLTHGRLCELPATRELASALVAEGRAVAEALGIELDSDPDELIDHAAEVAYEHQASMLQDVLAERATEVDALNGGISRFGDEGGVPTPMNRAVWALVQGLERSWTQPR